MPYIDQGEPKAPTPLPPVMPLALAIVCAGLGAASWLGSYLWFGMSYPGAVVAGLLIGVGVKLTLRRPFAPMRVIAMMLTVFASVGGYYWVDAAYFPPSPIGETLSFYFKDIQALLFTGVGAYLAFVLATTRAVVHSSQHSSQA